MPRNISFFIRKVEKYDEPIVEQIWKNGIMNDERDHFFPILLKQKSIFCIFATMATIFALLEQYILCIIAPVLVWIWVYLHHYFYTKSYVDTDIGNRSIYGDQLFVAVLPATSTIVGIAAFTKVTSLGCRNFPDAALFIKSVRYHQLKIFRFL